MSESRHPATLISASRSPGSSSSSSCRRSCPNRWWQLPSASMFPPAVLEVPDFVGERDVVGVCRPRHARRRSRGRVHRVVGVRLLAARRGVRLEQRMREPVRDARGHDPVWPVVRSSTVVTRPAVGVVDRDGDLVARVHVEHVRPGHTGADEVEVERVGRPLRDAIQRQIGEVDVLFARTLEAVVVVRSASGSLTGRRRSSPRTTVVRRS